MSDVLKVKEFEQEYLINSFKEQHKELSENWNVIELKSQNVVAINGVFIAAFFAFIRLDGIVQKSQDKIMLTIALLLVMTSLLFAFRALTLRTLTSTPLGEGLKLLFDDFKKTDNEINDSRVKKLRAGLLKDWNDACESLRENNNSKTKNLKWAQRFLVFSIFIISFLLLITIWGL